MFWTSSYVLYIRRLCRKIRKNCVCKLYQLQYEYYMRERRGKKGHTIDATLHPHAFHLIRYCCLLQQSSSTADIMLRDLKATIVENWRTRSLSKFRPGSIFLLCVSSSRRNIESLGIF